jgi:hypothetical protein
MYNRRLIILPAFLFGMYTASAQDVAEAFNLSNLTVQGTARSMGFGNALGSIGADFSSLSVNPAGIGIYRSSELTFTPSLRVNTASSQYQGTTTLDNNTHFNINNFGIVLTSAPKGKRYDKHNWKAISFGFGMNRTADYNRTYSYSGVNRNSSVTQAFESDANAFDVSTINTLGYIGWEGYLIDSIPGTHTQYKSVVPFQGGITQLKSLTEHGRVNEYVLSLGGNYREKLMLGATLGLTGINYESTSYYSEEIAPGNTAPNPQNFNSFSYQQALQVSGGGVNLKLGGIYKITDYLRVGAAFHTPTIYNVTDILNPLVNSFVNNQQTMLSVGNGALQQNQFDYSFASPWRGILSATFILKGVGFVTADYEYVGYNSMRYIYPESDGYGYSYQREEDLINQNIRNTYQSTSNFRVGAEALITKYFMVRAGFGYYGNAFKNGNSERLDFSGGVGFHFRHFFTDLALVHSSYQQQAQPYSVDYNYVISGAPAIVPTATTDFGSNNIAWTVGLKF